ncbi:pilus assembly protein TadG [Caballeronia mineralivorans PML1(12)]|uniref:Pilus assembly protein TadG n=1 Tax=Caballeronia mineralivorans PML1(12) TaxID=908627 RepID=A0A0J1CS78_9BURK|nr:TadE/TadG family type IV pilus assembly protein [Caballeronia mineralivorans]KLU23505.1 pilus assembly protein TadG [Caballeronia mineralivorans PML1(12)]
MTTKRRRFIAARSRQRGVAAVEFALVAGVFCTLLIGICEFARVLFYWNTASEAMREGARVAVVCDLNAAGIANNVTGLMPTIPASSVSVSYAPSGCTASTCSTVTVSISNVPVNTVIPFVPLTLMMPAFTTTLPRESLTSSSGGSACN